MINKKSYFFKDHTFCSKCIEEYISKFKGKDNEKACCPICGRVIIRPIKNRLLNQIIPEFVDLRKSKKVSQDEVQRQVREATATLQQKMEEAQKQALEE